jgi:hypothetical protein
VAAALYDNTKNKLVAYFEQTFDEGANVKRAVTTGQATPFPDLAPPADLATKLIWQQTKLPK